MTQQQNSAPVSTTTKPRPIKVWQIIVALVVIAMLAMGIDWSESTTVIRKEGPIRPINLAAVPQSVVPASVSIAPAAEANASVVEPVAPVVETVSAAASAEPVASRKTYTVKPGDWLSRVFPGNWKAVCERNQLADCGHIVPGQVLLLSEDKGSQAVAVVPSSKQVKRSIKPLPVRVTGQYQSAATKVPKAKRPDHPVMRRVQASCVQSSKKNAAGEILYVCVGTAPLNGCGKRSVASISEEAWKVLGLSDDDRAYLREHADLVNGPRISAASTEGRYRLEPDKRLEQVTFCRQGKGVASVGPMRTAWAADAAVYGERFVLPSGTVLVWMRNCFNWVILSEEKTVLAPTPPMSEEPPVAEIPPPEIAVPPRIMEVTQPAKYWETAEKLYVGGDFDRFSSSYFVNGAYYPLVWRKPWGRFLLGGAFEYSEWSGTNRGFRFDGDKFPYGVEARWQLDSGHDLSIGLLSGKINESGSNGEYAMARRCKVAGPSIAYSNYMRELQGHTIAPEFSVFLSILWGQGCSGDHTWLGNPIADKSELLRLNKLVSAGFRVILVKTEQFRFFASAGYFEEDPGARSASVRFGVSDKYKIIFVGAGWNFDLLNGGHVPAWGFAIDVMRGVYVYRNHVLERAAMAAIVKAGGAVQNGIVFVHTPADPEAIEPESAANTSTEAAQE